MLPGLDHRYDPEPFLRNWAAEIRGGYTPDADLDVLERLCEYLDADVPPDVDAAVQATATEATARLLAEARAEEERWTSRTPNDALTAAFAALDHHGILALERAGVTIHDGWAVVGQRLRARHRGAVFFHTQDVIDAVEGLPLLLAFDAVTGSAPARIAEEVLDALSAHGLGASWSGAPEDRIAVDPFPWARRRWTPAPPGPPPAPAPWRREPRALPLFVPTEQAARTYACDVYAYRTCHALDLQHAALARGAWRALGGDRGQLGTEGDPHTFVPAGGLVRLVPRDATLNLDPVEAAALRRR